MGFSESLNFGVVEDCKDYFASYYLTFRCLLKVQESFASMVSSQHWQVLKDRSPTAVDRQGFEQVEETTLDGLFWARVREALQFTKSIYTMTCFVDTDKPVIGEVYEQMDNMFGK